MRPRGLACCAGAALVLLAGCGGDDHSASKPASARTDGAKVIGVSAMDDAKGTVTYCLGKDSAGNAHAMIKAFNDKYGKAGLTAKLVEFPASADEQRNQFIQRQEAKSGDCDVFSSDVIWTAEFASQKWLYDLTPYMKARAAKYLHAPIATATFDGKIWGAPEDTAGSFIYYRTDRVKSPPSTWQQLYASAAENGGIVYQGAPYEGLTCDFLELLYAAGGSVLSKDGTQATIDSPQAVRALRFMAGGIEDGAAPRSVSTYMEAESLSAFQTGRYAYMRNWPYAYALNQKAPKVRGKFAVAPLPAFEGGGRAGILGGHNSVISVYSKNPGAALTLVDFIGSDQIQTMYAAEYALGPTTHAAYDAPAVKKALPFSGELEQAVEQARPRPVSPVYPQISQAIYKNVNRALAGQASPEDAIEQAQRDITSALKTF